MIQSGAVHLAPRLISGSPSRLGLAFIYDFVTLLLRCMCIDIYIYKYVSMYIYIYIYVYYAY